MYTGPGGEVACILDDNGLYYVGMWQLQEDIRMNKGTCTQRKDSERRRQATDRRKDRPTDVQTEID